MRRTHQKLYGWIIEKNKTKTNKYTVVKQHLQNIIPYKKILPVGGVFTG